MKEQTTIRLPNELKEQLQREAEKIGIGFNELIILIINEFIPQLKRLDHFPFQKQQYDE